MRLSDVFGHDRVRAVLARALERDRLPPGLLFDGPDGVGKKTLALAVAQGTMGEEGTLRLGALLARLWRDVFGSIAAGIVVGGILTLYLRFVQREMILFAVMAVFATAFAAQTLHFELLLSLLVAGFLVENVAPVRAEPLVHALQETAGPVFVVFFALAGAELHLEAFLGLWPVVLVLALPAGIVGTFGNLARKLRKD